MEIMTLFCFLTRKITYGEKDEWTKRIQTVGRTAQMQSLFKQTGTDVTGEINDRIRTAGSQQQSQFTDNGNAGTQSAPQQNRRERVIL